MSIVIRKPKDEEKEVYLRSVLESARNHSIKSGVLSRDVRIRIKDYVLELKKGDYVMFYGNKPVDVRNLGHKLKDLGYEVIFIDSFTLSSLFFA